MKGVALLSLAALAACGQASSRGTAASASRTLAVAGISVGATPAQVAATLAKAGYTKGPSTMGPSFEQAVQRARGNDSLHYVAAIKEENYVKAAESISVDYVPMPGGPVVVDLSYFVPAGVASTQQVLDELTRRYGPATRDFQTTLGREIAWCAKPAPRCERTDQHISVSYGQKTQVFLQDVSLRDKQRQAILAAPGKAKPSF